MVLVVVVVAAGIDLRTRKIYDWLTYPLLIGGLVFNFVSGGQEQGLFAIGGCVLGWLVMVLPDPKANMGGGDTKLMMAIGACLGPSLLLLSWGYFALVYGVIAVCWILRIRFLRRSDSSTISRSDNFKEANQKPVRKATLPLAPAIALGTMVAIWLEKPTLQLLGILK